MLEAVGSALADKYAEGWPQRRYYRGCEQVDRAEDLAVARARALFGAEHANVQPHCGTSANIAVYMSCLKAGDTMIKIARTELGNEHRLKEIQALNPGLDPSKLRPGQEILIPAK